MKKTYEALTFLIVLALFIAGFYFCGKIDPKVGRPITAASSPTQTQGDVRPAQTGQVSTTVGALRMRRRHENDMDFSKYNPFYWQGRLAEYRIEDYTSRGENRITVTLTTEWPQDFTVYRGPDFSAAYTGNPLAPTENDRSKFLFNMRMQHVRDARVFTATLDQGAFNAAGVAMQPGKILTMEFRFFLTEGNPDWQRQKQANVHNLSAYYSEFVRVKIGQPGLVIDHPFDKNGEASERRYAGGSTTTPTARVEPWKALEQAAYNISPSRMQAFLFGRTWAHTDLTSGQHVGEDSDDKPSVFFEGDRAFRAGFQGGAYNVKACIGCHENNGTALLPNVGSPTSTLVIRTADTSTGGLQKHPAFGAQVQPQGPRSEGEVVLTRFETRVENLSEGETVELRRPVFEVRSGLSKTNLGISPRRPLPWVGLGLLEAVPDETIRALAATNGGTLSVTDGRIGRFGHKAERVDLIDQTTSAFNFDLGVKLERYPYKDCYNGCADGKGQLFFAAVDDLVTYVSLLGVPPRLNPTDPQVVRGQLAFGKTLCNSCHVPDLRTGGHRFPELANQNIQPFTDLLLHDMGPGLQDDINNSLQRKWRTTPLRGMSAKRASTDSRQSQFRPGNVAILWTDAWKAVEGNRLEFLHDGRARNFAEAILWHGGEAAASREAFKRLTRAEREDLYRFLWDI